MVLGDSVGGSEGCGCGGGRTRDGEGGARWLLALRAMYDHSTRAMHASTGANAAALAGTVA